MSIVHSGRVIASYNNLTVINCQCGIAHLWPLPSEAETTAYYDSDLFYQTHSPPGWFERNAQEYRAGNWQTSFNYQASLLRINDQYPRLVDIGCGDGWFVYHYNTHLAPAWGIEPSASARLSFTGQLSHCTR